MPMTSLQNVKNQELINYFPESVLKTLRSDREFWDEYQEHKSKLYTDNPWNLELITEQMQIEVKATGNLGTVTDYHTTEVGKLNGGVEIEFEDGTKDYFYPHQIKLVDDI